MYCRYHYLEGHEFNTPEDELRHFLKKLEDPKWKWHEQYQGDSKVDHEEISDRDEREDLQDSKMTLR